MDRLAVLRRRTGWDAKAAAEMLEVRLVWGLLSCLVCCLLPEGNLGQVQAWKPAAAVRQGSRQRR